MAAIPLVAISSGLHQGSATFGAYEHRWFTELGNPAPVAIPGNSRS